MNDLLHSVREGRLLRLTLNRPEKRNALDAALCRALVAALDEAARDPAVGAILLTGQRQGLLRRHGPRRDRRRAPIPAEINAVHEQLFTVGARLTKPI